MDPEPEHSIYEIESEHYSTNALHHIQLIKREEDTLTVFDLGTVYITGPCSCEIGHDHTKLKYHIHPLEIFPSLQLFIAGWPLIGKVIKTYSATEVETEHNYNYA